MIVDIVDKYLTDDNNPIKNLRLRRVRQILFQGKVALGLDDRFKISGIWF